MISGTEVLRRTGDLDDLNEAISKAEEAVYLHNTPPRVRIKAGLQAARMLTVAQEWVKVSNVRYRYGTSPKG